MRKTIVSYFSEEEEAILNRASELDKRSRSNLIRKASLGYAKEVIQNEKTNRIQ